jgi:hypothetical protein
MTDEQFRDLMRRRRLMTSRIFISSPSALKLVCGPPLDSVEVFSVPAVAKLQRHHAGRARIAAIAS